jgi:hypothetical protein
MSRSGPRLEAMSLSSERMPGENMSGPIESPCLTPCSELMICLPAGELRMGLDVEPYAHLPTR